MLNRIWAKNFKAFKRLDYKCAKLNLLTGLNGAGKSSFVQLMLLLRATANKIGNCQAEIDLRESGIAKSFSDIRYCYADKDEQTSFSVDFTGRFRPNKDVEMPASKSRKISRIVTEVGTSPRNVMIWYPDAYEEVAKCQKKQEEAWLELAADGIDNKMHQDIMEKSDAACVAACEKFAESERSAQEEYEGLWRRMRFIEAFRKRPQAVHEGIDIPRRAQWFSFGLDGRFDPEGGDIAEFLYKYGTIFKLMDNNPMVHPNDKQHFVARLFTEDEFECSPSTPLIEQVNAWLDEISPGARFCVERVELCDEESFVVKIGFGEESNARQFKPQNVGLGISYVLPVLATLLSALPGAIIIIENPEAHIHPRGQSKLGELIARAAAFGVQLFVETHSDHVINGVRVAVRDGILKPEDVNIAFFERRPHQVLGVDGEICTEIYSEINPIRVDNNGMLSDYPKGFLDEWDNQLEELM